MGTRSAIGYKTPEGKIRAKYSHYDGYPACTGAILQDHYQEARKIGQMVELGDQSFLEEEIFPKGEHSFSKPEDGVTVFYGRDRGEPMEDVYYESKDEVPEWLLGYNPNGPWLKQHGVKAQEFDTVQEFVDYYADAGCEYFYLHTTDGWIVHDRYGVGKDANGYPVFDYLENKLPA